MSYQFTIIVPVFNEVDNLIRLEKELKKYLKIASKKRSQYHKRNTIVESLEGLIKLS